MKQCIKCGSYAINHHLHGRDGSRPDLCDVCFWRDVASGFERKLYDANQRIKVLEQAGDDLCVHITNWEVVKRWDRVKEDKP